MDVLLQLVDADDPKAGGPYFPYSAPIPEVGDLVRHPGIVGIVARREFVFHEEALHFVVIHVRRA